MHVTFKLHAELRKAFGRKELPISIEREAATLADAIDALLAIEIADERAARIIVSSPMPRASIASGAALNPAVIILINDADFRLVGGLDAPVHDGDSITLLPTIHGG